jgi:hypothetical protein
VKQMIGFQLDLFAPTPRTSAAGLDTMLPRACKCGAPYATVCPGKGAHSGEFRCPKCGRHRGWISRETSDFISGVVDRFGRPTEPLVVRASKA